MSEAITQNNTPVVNLLVSSDPDKMLASITYPANSVTQEYKIDEGTWTSADILTANKSINNMFILQVDAANAVLKAEVLVPYGSKIYARVTTENNKTYSGSSSAAETQLDLSTTDLTKNLSVNPQFIESSTIKEYRIGTGNWTPYTGNINITANGIVYVREIDGNNNIISFSKKNITNIQERGLTTVVPTGYTAIKTIADFNNIRNNMAGKYILMNDIDFTGYSYPDPTGGFVPFPGFSSGILDGNGYKIINLYINRTLRSDFVAPFHGITTGGLIKSLGMVNVSVRNSPYNNEEYFAAGLVGSMTGGKVSGCYVTGNIYGGNCVGGIAAESSSSASIIENCWAGVSIYGIGYQKGGIISHCGGKVINCYAKVSFVNGTTYGGIVGYALGGLSITNSYWNKDLTTAVSLAGAASKTTAEMKQKATYSGWDFTNIWTIKEGVDYPHFKWE